MNAKPVMLSGIKPSGELHIGNYFGAMRQLVELSKIGKYQSYIFVADYHALNTLQDAEAMRRHIEELVRGYIAVGLDPKEVVLFKQSDVPQHTELAWIFDTITTMPYLMRAHAYKDAEAKNKEISVGTFNYPMLMAADILLYDTAVVPVGADQKQHVEYARDTAEKFNRVFKTDVFNLPEDYILPDVAIVPGTDGQKMSKSYHNTIPLFASRDEIVKCVMSIVTDSGTAAELNLIGGMNSEPHADWLQPINLYRIHQLVRSPNELKKMYADNKNNYKALKEILIDDLDRYFAPMREKYEELKKDPSLIKQILLDGKNTARSVAEAKMERVRAAVGVA